MKKYIIILAVIFLICIGTFTYIEFIYLNNFDYNSNSSTDNKTKNANDSLIDFYTLYNCDNIYNASQFVIRNESEFTKYNCNDVDFENYMVIGVSMGIRNTGGFSIRITKIKELENSIQVSVITNNPDPEDSVTQVITFPAHIVVVEKNDKPVQFVTQNYVGGGI